MLRFIAKNRLKGDKLPEMPPKLSPFGSQTSPKSRVARFDYYIKELMKIEGISNPFPIQITASNCWSFWRSTATPARQISTNRLKLPPICSNTASGPTSAISWTKLPRDLSYSIIRVKEMPFILWILQMLLILQKICENKTLRNIIE